MAASAESMLSSLAGPAEGSEGSAPASEPAATDTAVAAPSTAVAVTDPEQSAPPAQETQQPAAAAAPSQPKDSPEDIQRKLNAALHDTRGENKSLRQELAQMRAELDAMKAGAPKQETQEPEPDFLADPKAYVDRVDKKVQTALEKLDKTTQETAEQVKQREANEAVLRSTQTAEMQFVAQNPDYPQALQHIRNVRTSQLQMLYPDATSEQISNHIAFEERETARGMIANGRNPAEFAYNIAKTLGYQKAAPPPPPKPTPTIDKDAVRTLGSGGGSGAPTEDAGNSMPEFTAALSERFKRKK